MPILNRVARAAVKPLPRIIPTKAHAKLDYFIAGSLFASAGWLWSRNRRAALAALMCGGAELGLNLLTDYPGGPSGPISFSAHREIEKGLAAMSAAMPQLFGFNNQSERKLFSAHAVLTTIISQLTQAPDACPYDARRYRSEPVARGPAA
jgi:hypothetical protein